MKLAAVQQQQHQTEMELTDAQMLLRSVGNGGSDEDDDIDDTEFQQKLGKIRRDADLSKRKLEQQHAEDVERLETVKRQLERKVRVELN